MKFVKGWQSAVSDALKTGQKILKKAEIPQPDSESEALLSATIQKPREFIYAHQEYDISTAETKKFNAYIARRAKREPLAYITGIKEFYGFPFLVNKNILIPRPETEGLVDLALNEIKALQNMGINNMDIIDVGTGSGAIIISLAKTILSANYSPSKIFQKNLGGQATNYSLPTTNFYGLDSSKRALAIAQENSKRLGVSRDIQFLRGHLLQSYFQTLRSTQQYRNIEISKYRIILANLPYLTTSEMKNLQPEVRYEPRKALDGGIDGLDVYRKLFQQFTGIKSEPLAAICEIAPAQKNGFLKIAKSALPQSATEFIKDLSGRTRFASIKNPPR